MMLQTEVRAHPRRGTRGVRKHVRLFTREWVKVRDFPTFDAAERYADKHNIDDWVIDPLGNWTERKRR